MTATLTPPRTPAPHDVRRPLTLLATVGGAVAASSTLVTCFGIGVIGWFLTDGGVHGEPRDGIHAGATAWLMAHGSGVHVHGVPVTVIPLGLTLVCAWVVWRFGLRLGESVSGYGPDANALSDGERDWTVPAAAGLFTSAYLLVGLATCILASTSAAEPALGPVLVWCLLLAGLVGSVAIAVGSGRAALWLSLVPAAARVTVTTAGWMLAAHLVSAVLLLAGALVVDLDAALNVLSRLHTDAGDKVLFGLLTLTVVPNAVICSGAYLLGPGFAVGTGTLVSPSVVAIGPVPLFPLLAALPDNGPTPVWTPFLVVVPVAVAAAGAIRGHRRNPTVQWDQGALRGGVAGVLTGVAFALLAAVAGGAAGPGRMAEVGPLVGQVLVSGIVSFGIGGLLGGVAATWWLRRGLGPEALAGGRAGAVGADAADADVAPRRTPLGALLSRLRRD